MTNKASNPAQPKAAGKGGKDNQGEGDKRSAKRFNSDQTEFVQSERGQDAIDQASDVAPEDEAELAQAEREGASRAKGEDPAVRRQRDNPDRAK